MKENGNGTKHFISQTVNSMKLPSQVIYRSFLLLFHCSRHFFQSVIMDNHQNEKNMINHRKPINNNKSSLVSDHLIQLIFRFDIRSLRTQVILSILTTFLIVLIIIAIVLGVILTPNSRSIEQPSKI